MADERHGRFLGIFPRRAGTDSRPGTGARVVPTRRQVEVADGRDVRLPAVVVSAAAWSWRLLVIGALLLAVLRELDHLLLLVIPFLTAMLATALLMPVAHFLRRHGMSRGISTLLTIVLAIVVIGGVGFFVVDRAVAGYDQLANETTRAVTNIEKYLTGAPFHLQKSSIDNIGTTITNNLKSHQSTVTSGLVSVGKTAADVGTGTVLFLFLTIFLIYDGDRIWDWVSKLFPRDGEALVHGAGHRAWRTLSGYIIGQFQVALFHGVAIAITLVVEGSPLVAPLALIVFIFSFIPIIGAFIGGAFSVVVVLVALGPVQAIVLVVVLVVIDQIESHVLQPLVVGKAVKLHPVAIAATLTAGALVAGLPGAIFGVPVVAAANAAIKYLSGREDIDGNPVAREDRVVDEPDTPAWTEYGGDRAEAPSDAANAPTDGPAREGPGEDGRRPADASDATLTGPASGSTGPDYLGDPPAGGDDGPGAGATAPGRPEEERP